MLTINTLTEQTRIQVEAELHALRAEIDRLHTEITKLCTEEVPADDPRVRHIWIAAAREAESASFCREYDRIVDEVGGIDRYTLRDEGELDQPYRVRTHIVIEVDLMIDASSEDDAVTKIEQLDSDGLRSRALDEGADLTHLELHSWDAREAELDD